MKSYELSCLLLLLLIVQWNGANGQCSMETTTMIKCHYLEDARYTDTYQLLALRAPSGSHTLTPGHFRNLTSLRHLDLSGGKIERIESNSFAKLTSLQSLNLANNQISHLDAGAFDGLNHLHSLFLNSNQIRQLPAALMTLKGLRFLNVSDNPLNCNCASMKLRDSLRAREVKFAKKTYCFQPTFSRKNFIFEPDTKLTCATEMQDEEMQGDQPALDSSEGSGETEEGEARPNEEEEKKSTEEETVEEKDLLEEEKQKEKEEDQTVANEEEVETAAPTVVTEESSASSIISDDHSTEEVTSTTAAARDDITFDDSENSKKDVTTSSSVQEVTDDLIYAATVSKEPTDEAVGIDSPSKSDPSDDLIIQAPASEGSGEGDDDGSGVEGSGLIAKMPAIDFTEDAEETDEDTSSTTSTTTTTTEGTSWWGFGDIISNLNPFSSAETTTEVPRTTEKTAEQDLAEEQFFPVKKGDHVETNEDVQPKVSDENTTKKSPRTLKLPDNNDDNNVVTGTAADPAMSQESRKGMGSYIVLAILLAILAILVGIAAYKGDFCRNKPKRRDVERGTEMKDMRKALLDQNSATPKIQAVNGNTMENVPLMNSPTVPEEPKHNQRRYDVTPVVVTNGSSKSNGPTIEVNDPIKPPRKPTHPEIEAPLNGLNPPMDDIDGPTRNSLFDEPDEILGNGDCCERPPLSPGAQRVKITLQENPDSVPKTPILITRLKGGENLVKAP